MPIVARVVRAGVVAVLGLLAGAVVGAPARTDVSAMHSLSRQFVRLAREDDLSGAVLIARNGRVLFEHAYGEAERAFRVPNTVHTRFNLGSMNKMFTALAVLRLVEAGRLDLDAPLARAWPEYPNAAVASRVSVRQLLNHTAGLGNYWDGLSERPLHRYIEPVDYLPLCAPQSLEHEPGTTFSYSNCGFLVLGLLVEKVAGESYFAHIQRTIYKPLGMRDSGCYRVDTVTPDVAMGYTRDEAQVGVWRNNLFEHVVRGGPAGGCYSTLHDLLRFGEALRAGTLLPADLMEVYTRGTQEYPLGRYASGMSEQFVNGQRIIGHSGGHVGIASELLVLPASGHVAVILTNGDVDAFWHVRNAVIAALAGRDARSESYWNTVEMLALFERKGVAAVREFVRGPGGVRGLRGPVIDAAIGTLLHRGQDARAVAMAELWAEVEPGSAAAAERLETARRIVTQRAAPKSARPD